MVSENTIALAFGCRAGSWARRPAGRGGGAGGHPGLAAGEGVAGRAENGARQRSSADGPEARWGTRGCPRRRSTPPWHGAGEGGV
ncbi:MAG: hypothetical protein ACYDHX_06575 [Methanothrix sp.]